MLNTLYMYILIAKVLELWIYIILKMGIQETCRKYPVYIVYGVLLSRWFFGGSLWNSKKCCWEQHITYVFSVSFSFFFKNMPPKDDLNLVFVHFLSFYFPKEMFSFPLINMNLLIQ